MTMLTRELILSVDDLPRELVKVPEWGGDVYVRTMTGAERDKWEIEVATSKQKASESVRAMIAALTVCDENSNLLFTIQDVEALSKKSAAALDRVMDAAMRLNKLYGSDIEGLEKN